ncbi:hypothetical protein Agub_g12222, partial [Astrephomene gubernaculifera]
MRSALLPPPRTSVRNIIKPCLHGRLVRSGRRLRPYHPFHTSGPQSSAPVLIHLKQLPKAPLAPAAAAAQEPPPQQRRETSTARSSSSSGRGGGSSGRVGGSSGRGGGRGSRGAAPESRHGAAGRGGGNREAGGQDVKPPQWGRQGGRGGGGRGHGGPARGSCSADALRGAPDLRTLMALIEDLAPAWAAAGDVDSLRTAFSVLVRLGSRPGADTRLLPRALTTLAAAYLPLVPGLGDAFSCVAPLYACAKLGFWEGQLPAALLERLGRDGGKLMHGATAQGHSNLWWSLSSADAPPHLITLADGALNASAVCLEQMRPSELGPQACSNILLACARLQRRHDPLLHHLTACLVQLPDAKCQELANSLYALGKLAESCGHKPRQQDLRSLAGRVLQRLLSQQPGRQHGEGFQGDADRFVPQALSNMLLGCAKLGFSQPELVQSMAAALAGSSQRVAEQQLANALYALAALGCSGAGFTSATKQLFDEVRWRLHSTPGHFIPQHLSNLLWALERLRPGGQQEALLQEALAAECRRRLFAGFKPQELGNAAWALARMGFSEQDWYEAAVAAALVSGAMRGANAQAWANMWYALALVRHRPPDALMEATTAALREVTAAAAAAAGDNNGNGGKHASGGRLLGPTPQACSNLLWSLATLGLYQQ